MLIGHPDKLGAFRYGVLCLLGTTTGQVTVNFLSTLQAWAESDVTPTSLARILVLIRLIEVNRNSSLMNPEIRAVMQQWGQKRSYSQGFLRVLMDATDNAHEYPEVMRCLALRGKNILIRFSPIPLITDLALCTHR